MVRSPRWSWVRPNCRNCGRLLGLYESESPFVSCCLALDGKKDCLFCSGRKVCSLGPTRRILVLIAYHIFYSPCYGGNLGYACYLVVKSYLRYGSNHGLSIILHLSAMLEFGDTLEFAFRAAPLRQY